MQAPNKHPDEENRLEALRSLGLLDSEPEERFDRYTRIAKFMFDVPIATVSLVDEDRQWFKSKQGLDLEETPRDVSFCGHAILDGAITVVPDAREDARFSDNPLVTGGPLVRFYAGCPIKTPRGDVLGTICIIDQKPREFSQQDLDLLRDLADMVEGEFMIQSIATVDDLTGLSNRRGFMSIAQHAIAMCSRLRKPATLMFFDLDGFKAVNDEFGHNQGDKALVDISKMLLREFRNSDVIARLGGDEFCVLLTGTNADHLEKPLENLDHMFREENANNPYTLGYSVGTVAFSPAKHKDVRDLIKEADQLMYESKRQKKAR